MKKYDRNNLHKVSNDNPLDGANPTEWRFDEEDGIYIRFQGEVPVRRIKGSSIPDPNQIRQSRRDTIDAIIKHISADKIHKLAKIAERKGIPPEKHILDTLKLRAEPSSAVQAMWDHWQGVKDG